MVHSILVYTFTAWRPSSSEAAGATNWRWRKIWLGLIIADFDIQQEDLHCRPTCV